MPFGGYNPLDDGPLDEYEDFSPWFKPKDKVMPDNNERLTIMVLFNKVPDNNDIVQRIDKLILGWEREYGVTNKTMVDAMLEIVDLRSKLSGYDDLHTIIEKQEEEIEMMKAQLLIRKDLIEKLKSGPGGIMEMKQTIADKEAELNDCNLGFNDQVEENYLQSLDIERLETEIEQLRKDLDLVYAHDSNLIDHLKGWK